MNIYEQVAAIKAEYPNAIVLYLLGDFYEAFNEDAEVIADELDLTLVARSTGRDKRIPMAGFPHFKIDEFIARLVENGHTVAVASPVGDELIDGVLPRQVTETHTPLED